MKKKNESITKKELSWIEIILLASLTIPRTVGHDMKILTEGSASNSLLALIPFAIWIFVVYWKNVSSPILTMVKIGLVYGIILTIIHQLMWDSYWRDNLPKLGDNLQGQLDPNTEMVVMRIALFISSLLTGVMTGLIMGVAAKGMTLFNTKNRNKSA